MEWKWTEEYYQSIGRQRALYLLATASKRHHRWTRATTIHCIDDQTSQRQLWTDDMEAMMMVNIMTSSAKQNDIHRRTVKHR